MVRQICVFGLVLALGAAAAAQGGVDTQPAATEVQQLREENAALRARVRELEGELAAVRKEPATRPAAAKPLTPIERAIAEHRVVEGMTVAEADKALGVQHNAIDDPAEYHRLTGLYDRAGDGIFCWGVWNKEGTGFAYQVRAVVVNGKITRVQKK